MHRFKRWRDALQATPNAEAVVRVIRDYITALPSEVVDALPEDCAGALAVESAMDVQAAAVTLLHCELGYAGEPGTGDVLHEIAHTLAVAAMRLTSLGGGAFTEARQDRSPVA